VTAYQQALERIAEILEQMPSVSHLHSLWRTLPYRLRIGAGTVACDDAYLALGCQPVCHRHGISIAKQVDWPVTVQIDHHGSIPMSATESPVIDAKLMRRGVRLGSPGRRHTFQCTKNGLATDVDA
jgi:hypothetical protein